LQACSKNIAIADIEATISTNEAAEEGHLAGLREVLRACSAVPSSHYRYYVQPLRANLYDADPPKLRILFSMIKPYRDHIPPVNPTHRPVHSINANVLLSRPYKLTLQ
jgi:hypothetical protein